MKFQVPQGTFPFHADEGKRCFSKAFLIFKIEGLEIISYAKRYHSCILNEIIFEWRSGNLWRIVSRDFDYRTTGPSHFSVYYSWKKLSVASQRVTPQPFSNAVFLCPGLNLNSDRITGVSSGAFVSCISTQLLLEST